MKRRSRFTVLVIIGLVAIAVGGCAKPVSGSVAAREAPAIADELDSLSQTIGGTPQQRAAGELVDYHAYQDPIMNCMTRDGFSYAPPPFVNPYAGETVIHMGTGDANWFAPLSSDSLGVAESIERVAPMDQLSANPGYTTLTDARKTLYNEALDRCQPSGFTDVNIPPMAAQLQGDFLDMMLSVANSSQVKTSGNNYGSCLAGHGIAAASYDDLVQDITGTYSHAHAPTASRPADAAWLAAQVKEQQAAAADVACRTATYNLAMVLIEPKLTAFEKQHATDLATATTQWNALIAKASTLKDASLLGK